MIALAREKVQEFQNKFDIKNDGFWGLFVKGVLWGLIILIIFGYIAFRLAYFEKAFPGLMFSGIDVSGKSFEEVLYELDTKVNEYQQKYPEIELGYENYQWLLSLDKLGFDLDEEGVKDVVSSAGRSGSVFEQIRDQWQLFYYGKNVLLPISLNLDLLNDFVSTASAEISNPPIPPRVYIGTYYNRTTESLVFSEEGSPGDEVDEKEVVNKLKKSLGMLEPARVALSLQEVSYEVNEEQINNVVEKVKKLQNMQLIIERSDLKTKEKLSWTLYDKDLVSFLSVMDGFDNEKIDEYVGLISEAVNRSAQNALFQFDEGSNKVVTFKPSKNGVEVQADKLRMAIKEKINLIVELENNELIEIEVNETEPKVTNSEVNNLGIESLLGHGESTYYHSSYSRKHNVELAAAKMNGVLVSPGEEFSLNKALGEVSMATGFKQALIIKEGETILDDGGGVCQDSTTLFRAVLDAGLPITMWRNHSFRVGYYEQNSKPGFDATVFSPLPDFRFINDTPNYILIQTKASNMKLEYDLYGTDDGRESEISNYAQWDASPPPPDLYKDDPTLPIGEIKQVESAVPGLKTKFDYTVTRDGETIFEKTFYSVYQPWQAVYLRGTKG